MARGRLTIYDVPPEARTKGASEARKTLLQMLSNPHLTKEQKEDLTARLKWVSKWENLNVSEVLLKDSETPISGPLESDREPVNHDISLSESMTVVLDQESDSEEG